MTYFVKVSVGHRFSEFKCGMEWGLGVVVTRGGQRDSVSIQGTDDGDLREMAKTFRQLADRLEEMHAKFCPEPPPKAPELELIDP
jgi:hypothetical protein